MSISDTDRTRGGGRTDVAADPGTGLEEPALGERRDENSDVDDPADHVAPERPDAGSPGDAAAAIENAHLRTTAQADRPVAERATLIADAESVRARWRDVQLRFVDDPAAATADAGALVDETLAQLTARLRERGDGTDTEALRIRLRTYRDVLDRLLDL